jgi:hypothetical protein
MQDMEINEEFHADVRILVFNEVSGWDFLSVMYELSEKIQHIYLETMLSPNEKCMYNGIFRHGQDWMGIQLGIYST